MLRWDKILRFSSASLPTCRPRQKIRARLITILCSKIISFTFRSLTISSQKSILTLICLWNQSRSLRRKEQLQLESVLNFPLLTIEKQNYSKKIQNFIFQRPIMIKQVVRQTLSLIVQKDREAAWFEPVFYVSMQVAKRNLREIPVKFYQSRNWRKSTITDSANTRVTKK